MHTAVIGAGITGPAAALALRKAGHDVTVYERRTSDDLWSGGVIGITAANVAQLSALGGAHSLVVNPAGVTTIRAAVANRQIMTATDHSWPANYNFVVWGELHETLVHLAEAAGVQFRWRAAPPADGFDLTVHAAGVGYAAHKVAAGHQAMAPLGYTVFRANSARTTTLPWVSLKERGRFILNIAQSRQGFAHWMLYVHEDGAPLRTVNVTGERWNAAYGVARRYVPDEALAYLTDTPGPVQASPMSAWGMPDLVTWRDASGQHVDMGDAIAPVSPHTAMGANLALSEAFSLPAAVGSPETLAAWVTATRGALSEQLERGAGMARAWMGKAQSS